MKFIVLTEVIDILNMYKSRDFFAFFFPTRCKITVNTNGKCSCHEVVRPPPTSKNGGTGQMTCKLQDKMRASCAPYPDIRANNKDAKLVHIATTFEVKLWAHNSGPSNSPDSPPSLSWGLASMLFRCICSWNRGNGAQHCDAKNHLVLEESHGAY